MNHYLKATEPQTAGRKPQISKEAQHRMHTLIVTDQPLVALGLQAALKLLPAVGQVEVTHPKFAGLRDGSYDLVLLDMEARGARRSAGEHIRQLHPDAILIALSPSDDAAPESGLALTACLSKTLPVHALALALADVLAGTSARA